MKNIMVLISMLFLMGGSYSGPTAPPGDTWNGRHCPPPEAYKACEEKSAGSLAQFVNPQGQIITGTCEEKDG
jgi:hypothetical protein